jgi:Big-like domain-containing protein/Kelch motif protein
MRAHATPRSVSNTIRAGFVAFVASICATALAYGTGAFTPTGSMSAGRDSAAAVLLDDGRVLVTGGNLSQTSELYDPSTGAFSTTGALNEVRSGTAGVRLDDGRVLVAGGWDGSAALSTAELYQPATGLFTMVGNMSTRRVGLTITRLDDGRVLIAGGHDGAVPAATAELYDPQSETFAPTGNMGTARMGSATLLSNGTVLVAGGMTPDGSYTAAAEIYDPAIGAFVPTGSLAIARHGHDATRLADGRVLITGGLDNTGTSIADAELYDPREGVFRPAGRMGTARTEHRALLLSSGGVLAIGGRDRSGVISSAELYDPATDSFTSAAGLAEARATPAVVSLADGRLLVAGGRALGDRLVDTAETYVVTQHPTSTSVTSNRSSSTYGQPVSYLARVTGIAGVPSGNVRFIDGGTLPLGTAPVDGAGAALLATELTPAGLRSITAEYEGSSSSGGSTSPAMSQSVGQAQTTSTLAVAPLSLAYSDVIKLEATISGAHGEPPAKGVFFKIGLQPMNNEAVPLENMGGGVWKGTLSTPLLEASSPGQLKPTGGVKIAKASFTGVSPNYSVSNPIARAFLVNREDARVAYDGPRAVATSSQGGSAATIPLKAIVRDITVTPDNNGDKNAGDVRLAQVHFIDRTTNAFIATVNVSLTDPNDTTTGIATYDWNVNIGPIASSKTYTVAMIVSNYYQRNNPSDNALITVTRKP